MYMCRSIFALSWGSVFGELDAIDVVHCSRSVVREHVSYVSCVAFFAWCVCVCVVCLLARLPLCGMCVRKPLPDS